MRCIDCKYMKIVSIDDGCGSAAKCYKKSSRGKSIIWAMTTISPQKDWEKEEGKDRVIKSLKAKKGSPHWCPIKKKQENEKNG